MTAPPPRVLLLGDTLNLGGTEGQMVEVACRLDQSRWETRVGCVRAEGPLRRRLDAAGIVPRTWGPRSFRSPGFLIAVLRLARHLRAARLRIIHSFDFYGNLLGVLAGRLARVPVVIASRRELGDLRPPLQCRVQRLALRAADYILVNSEAAARGLKQELGEVPGRIVTVPNGVDLGRFRPKCGRAAGDLPAIGTVGNLRPEKGLADLVPAAAMVRERYPQSRVLICGDGPLRPDLERLIASLGLDAGVALLGHTPGTEEVLRGLDIFVLPSLSEACSNSLLEAMATALPVVATDVGGNPELVEDGETGLLVPPADPAALAKAVIRLLEDPALAARLGARAREKVEREHGVDRMVARIEALYLRALAERRR